MKQKKIKVSVIICAYNEQKHIKQTLQDLLNCPAAEEVIVVNDGSTDKTLKILKEFKDQIKLISYRKNRGKGYAMVQAIKAAQGKVVVFLDAHLKGLQNSHIKNLSDPILSRETNYVLAQCGTSSPLNAGFLRFYPITGQRAYLKQLLLPYLDHLKKTRFGIETYLNEIFKPKWGKTISFSNLIHLPKHQKMPTAEVIPAYIQEILEISKTKLEIRTRNHQQLRKILNPKKIKSIKTLRQKVDEIKDKEISELIKIYIIPYLKKITKS